ncbi:MAG: isoprenylcysteine carboxylmethyltransferase family protein [Syntrophaceae bacterium]
MWHRLTTAFIIIFLYISTAHAADINLTVLQSSQDNDITVTAENNSSREIIIDSVSVEIVHQQYEQKLRETYGTHQKKDIHFTISNPSLPGSYLLTTTIRYLNDGQRLSVKDVRIFTFKQQANLNIPCHVGNVSIAGTGHIRVSSPAPYLWKLVLPEEIDVKSVDTFSDHRTFFVESRISGFSNSCPVFAGAEDVVSGVHRAGVCRGTLTVTTNNILPYNNGNIPSGILLGSALFIFCISGFLSSRQQNKTIISDALVKYTSRLFFLTVSYYFLKNVDTWLRLTLSLGDWKIYHDLVNILLGSLHSGNYCNFFKYFIDTYCICCIVFMLPYLYWLDRQTPVSKDKYVSFLKTLVSIPGIFLKRNIHWNSDSKLGMLTVLMKVFFVPLMVSWSISGIYNLQNSTALFQWNIYAINAYLVALFIFLDTTIFAVGYLVELPYLKNEIKSIDPTMLGWVVCLWCYPPFNTFSFKPFDWYVVKTGIECSVWCSVMLTCVITLLWGIFVWASISLGFKASNLTNRGIVKNGPYRFVRHPAYAAKVFIWIIQGAFFGQFGLFIMMGFIIIYFLRAWTEERHLSMDPNYVEYMKLVKWRFIPGLI